MRLIINTIIKMKQKYSRLFIIVTIPIIGLILYLSICIFIGNSISDKRFNKYFIDDNDFMINCYLKAHPEYITCQMSSTGRTLLHVAARKDKIKILKLLISKGAKINVSDNDNMTPLLYAIKRKNYDMLDCLVKPDTVNFYNNGNTPLFIALSTNDYNIVKFIIDKGANINTKDLDGDNCLQQYNSFLEKFTGFPKYDIVYKKHNKLIFEYLLISGADINNINNIKLSVLMSAITASNDEAVSQLLNYNVNILYKNSNGMTALDIAKFYMKFNVKKQEKIKIIKMIENAIKNNSNPENVKEIIK